MIRKAALLTCPIAFLAVGACRQGNGSSDHDATAEVHSSQIAFQLPERDLVPEGICYDPISESFFLGSIQRHRFKAGSFRDRCIKPVQELWDPPSRW